MREAVGDAQHPGGYGDSARGLAMAWWSVRISGQAWMLQRQLAVLYYILSNACQPSIPQISTS